MVVIVLSGYVLDPQNICALDTSVQAWLNSCYPHQYQLNVNWYGVFLHRLDLSAVTEFQLAWFI